MQTLQRGQKLKWDAIASTNQLQAGLAGVVPGATLDYSCFGVDENGKLSDERYFIFYNQKNSPCGGLSLRGAAGGDSERFALDLTKLPANIHRLVFVITIDGSGEMRQLQSGHWRLLDIGGNTLAEFPLRGADYGGEKALIAGELYRKDGWRVTATGQGFNGGLSALLKHFGGEEAATTPVPPPMPPPLPTATPPPLPGVPPPLPEAPSKLVLTKKTDAHKLSLAKGGQAPILVTAKWVDNGDGASDNDDLDLKAGILLPDGRMHIVHAENLGSLDRPPFVRHRGDVVEASLKAPGEESIEVNPRISELLGGPVAIVFSVYSAVGNGAVSIASLRPVMKLQCGNQQVECALDFTKDPKARGNSVYTYVIGLATIRGNEVEITPSGVVSDPGSEATAWISWEKGGAAQVSMDGPVVMKGSANAAAAKLNKKNPRRYE
ncbi:MAG: hypothetical protein EOP84_06830 [Verrucomicrobiaceae bacterium]|nr:MAG: hypothetical protein EOP84_06830 [Verrucomicrobiaceae bacterium]